MRYALVDCNNFFVSCERVFQPALENRAVVVLSNNDGCVVARSNESKAMGIKMGTPFFQIRHLVDAGRLVACSSNYALYGDLSARVMSILSEAVPKIEIYSIDEAFLQIDGIPEERLPQLCRDLVRRIRQWVGIPVSIGVAPTKTLAKIASHFAKRYKGYKGVCFIDNDQRRLKALSLTPIGDVWGVGRRIAPRLESVSVHTALDFVSRPQEWVRGNFGLSCARTWAELCGIPAVDEETGDARKSICTSRSFADMTDSLQDLQQRVAAFASECSRKLREEGTAASEITTFLYTNRFREDMDQYFPSATIRLPMATSSVREVVGAALRGLRAVYRPGFQYKKAGVIVSRIVPADSLQASLFDVDYSQRTKNDRLSDVIDKVNSLGYGRTDLVHLAVQDGGHYSEVLRREHCSRLYTTSLDDIIDVH